MTPEEHAAEIEGLIEGSIDEFSTYAESHQRTVLGKVQTDLSALIRTKDGRIKPTAQNIKLAKRISKGLSSIIISSKYRGKVDALTRSMQEVRVSIDTYLLESFANFDSNKAVFETIFDNAVFLTRNTLLESGLTPNVIAGIEKIIIDGTTGNMKYSDMLEQLRFFIVGDETHEGMLIGSGRGKMNVKTTLRDGINQYARNYRQTFETGIGGEWYSYCCGQVKDSREWCVERVGKFWHINEIRSWANDTWQGRNPGTTESNILIICGGFSCIHGFYMVSKAVVPQEDKDRAKRLGFI